MAPSKARQILALAVTRRATSPRATSAKVYGTSVSRSASTRAPLTGRRGKTQSEPKEQARLRPSMSLHSCTRSKTWARAALSMGEIPPAKAPASAESSKARLAKTARQLPFSTSSRATGQSRAEIRPSKRQPMGGSPVILPRKDMPSAKRKTVKQS